MGEEELLGAERLVHLFSEANVEFTSSVKVATPFLIISVCVWLNVFPTGAFHDTVARHVPSNRLLELEPEKSPDLSFAGADRASAGASVGDGFFSTTCAGDRCAELRSRVVPQTTASVRFILSIQSDHSAEVNGSSQEFDFPCESATSVRQTGRK